ncbi:DUF4357 domain-containing protein [Undibacterium sp.]|uniref:DUF4357 domain-containing protein n=1 Tax=Undibacterium sp. TaxID=1914977 RepID=UPI0037515BB8
MTRAPDTRVATVTLLNRVGKGLKAQGYESNQGFVLKENTQASVEVTASMQQQMHSIVDLRLDLIANEVLQRVGDRYVFKQDYSFSSPFTAAAIILGRSANGRTEWKDNTGRNLKEKGFCTTHVYQRKNSLDFQLFPTRTIF